MPTLTTGLTRGNGGSWEGSLCVNVLWLHFNLCISNVLAAHFYFITFHIKWQAETARRRRRKGERARETVCGRSGEREREAGRKKARVPVK